MNCTKQEAYSIIRQRDQDGAPLLLDLRLSSGSDSVITTRRLLHLAVNDFHLVPYAMCQSVRLEDLGFEYDESPLPNRLALTSESRPAQLMILIPADLQSATPTKVGISDQRALRIAEDMRST